MIDCNQAPIDGLKLPRLRSKTTTMTVGSRPYCRNLPALALLLALLPWSGALAQTPPTASALQPPSQPPPPMPPAASRPAPPVFTLSGPRGGNITPSAPPPAPLQLAPSPPPQPLPNLRPGEVALLASARFGGETPITGGLHWRVYADKPDHTGVFRLLKEDKSAAPAFALPVGRYILHVTFGLASAVKAVQLQGEVVREVFEIPAGGLRFEGRVGDACIPAGQISFDVYKGSQFEPSDKRPIAGSVMTGEMLLVPAGTYYIVSKYGDGNAVVRSDIHVQAGKLTDVMVTHRAAAIMFKLVSRKGGEALVNTEWAVVSPAGDVIVEMKGAFPRVILAEGEYRVIARNENKIYPQHVKVITGVDGEIEVLAK